MQRHTIIDVEATRDTPSRFVFVLLDQFTLLSFAAAVDCLRIANLMAGQELYTWTLVGEGGDTVGCSTGTSFNLEGDLSELHRDDTVIICGGRDVQAATTKKLLNWLRRESRRGITMGGLCTAAYSLAKAGLLDGKRATIHWENHDSFSEEFLEVELTKSVFVKDGNRWTTAGGTSSIDLFLQIIADQYGEELANAVADQQIYSTIRTDQDTQRLSIPTRIGVRHPKLSRVIQAMELQTDMSVINVALACGFASPSHFSKCYRSHYDTTPYRERGAHAARLSV